MYIVGYTVNGEDFALRSWYLDSVWAIKPTAEGCTCNVFRDHKTAERYCAKAKNSFHANLKEQYRGGKVWIRKVGSSKNPFQIVAPFSAHDLNDLAKHGWAKVKFFPKRG
jgi:hypothetical protein